MTHININILHTTMATNNETIGDINVSTPNLDVRFFSLDSNYRPSKKLGKQLQVVNRFPGERKRTMKAAITNFMKGMSKRLRKTKKGDQRQGNENTTSLLGKYPYTGSRLENPLSTNNVEQASAFTSYFTPSQQKKKAIQVVNSNSSVQSTQHTQPTSPNENTNSLSGNYPATGFRIVNALDTNNAAVEGEEEGEEGKEGTEEGEEGAEGGEEGEEGEEEAAEAAAAAAEAVEPAEEKAERVDSGKTMVYLRRAIDYIIAKFSKSNSHKNQELAKTAKNIQGSGKFNSRQILTLLNSALEAFKKSGNILGMVIIIAALGPFTLLYTAGRISKLKAKNIEEEIYSENEKFNVLNKKYEINNENSSIDDELKAMHEAIVNAESEDIDKNIPIPMHNDLSNPYLRLIGGLKRIKEFYQNKPTTEPDTESDTTSNNSDNESDTTPLIDDSPTDDASLFDDAIKVVETNDPEKMKQPLKNLIKKLEDDSQYGFAAFLAMLASPIIGRKFLAKSVVISSVGAFKALGRATVRARRAIASGTQKAYQGARSMVGRVASKTRKRFRRGRQPEITAGPVDHDKAIGYLRQAINEVRIFSQTSEPQDQELLVETNNLEKSIEDGSVDPERIENFLINAGNAFKEADKIDGKVIILAALSPFILLFKAGKISAERIQLAYNRTANENAINAETAAVTAISKQPAPTSGGNNNSPRAKKSRLIAGLTRIRDFFKRKNNPKAVTTANKAINAVGSGNRERMIKSLKNLGRILRKGSYYAFAALLAVLATPILGAGFLTGSVIAVGITAVGGIGYLTAKAARTVTSKVKHVIHTKTRTRKAVYNSSKTNFHELASALYKSAGSESCEKNWWVNQRLFKVKEKRYIQGYNDITILARIRKQLGIIIPYMIKKIPSVLVYRKHLTNPPTNYNVVIVAKVKNPQNNNISSTHKWFSLSSNDVVNNGNINEAKITRFVVDIINALGTQGRVHNTILTTLPWVPTVENIREKLNTIPWKPSYVGRHLQVWKYLVPENGAENIKCRDPTDTNNGGTAEEEEYEEA